MDVRIRILAFTPKIESFPYHLTGQIYLKFSFTAGCNEQVFSPTVNMKKKAKIRTVVFDENVKVA